MKNWEKYEAEIRKIGIRFAVDKLKEKPRKCKVDDGIECSECLFSTTIPCARARLDWFYKDDTKPPKLTKRERMFCELVETGWIARHKDGDVWHFDDKPEKAEHGWDGETYFHDLQRSPLNLKFDFINGYDTEPWSVEDLLKLEVEE